MYAAADGLPPREEVLRYLGYGNQPVTDELMRRLDEVGRECVRIARPASVVRSFPADALPLDLPGQNIADHLRDAVEVVLFAVTLGLGVDRELTRLSHVDALAQVIFDATATALVERAVDREESRIRARAAERGLFCSWRFSPGYGDLPLDVQPAFLRAIDAGRRLGITLTPSYLMVPTKSVTAIVGLHRTPQPGLASSCSVCQLAEFCELRVSGRRCHGA